jgi:hypothetical protein
MITTFTGFKGSVAFAQIGDIKFAILARNTRQLQILWQSIMAEAGSLDPAGVKKAILIEACTLPPARERSLARSTPVEPTTPIIEV